MLLTETHTLTFNPLMIHPSAHAVNPVPVMKLVELIPALQTDSNVLDVARGFAERMGKTVTLSADTPGA